MTDSYLGFTSSPLGSRIAAMLGLPQPVPLERYQPGQPLIRGSVLVGAGPNPSYWEHWPTYSSLSACKLWPTAMCRNGWVLPIQWA